MKKPDLNYLRVEFRVVSEKIFAEDIRNGIDLDRLCGLVKGDAKVQSQKGSQELSVSGRFSGPDRWEILDQVLDWTKRNELGIKKVRTHSDVRLDITSVCNIRGQKNPFPIQTKEKIKDITGLEVALHNESKEKQPANEIEAWKRRGH